MIYDPIHVCVCVCVCGWFSLSMLQDAIFFCIIVLKQCECIVCYVYVCIVLLLNLSLLHQIV